MPSPNSSRPQQKQVKLRRSGPPVSLPRPFIFKPSEAELKSAKRLRITNMWRQVLTVPLRGRDIHLSSRSSDTVWDYEVSQHATQLQRRGILRLRVLTDTEQASPGAPVSAALKPKK